MGETITENRNSWLRVLAKDLSESAGAAVHEQWPEVTGNDITALGIALSVVTVYAAANGNRVVAIGSVVGSQLADWLDGAVARASGMDSAEGALFDVTADRTKEAIQGLGRAVAAYQRQDYVGEFLAYANVMSNWVPSYLRAKAESQGKKVPESGEGIFGFGGTALGRGIGNSVATVFEPTQPVLDAFITICNGIASKQRWDVIKTPIKPEDRLDEEIRKQGQERAQRILQLGKVIDGSVALTFAVNRLHGNNPKEA